MLSLLLIHNSHRIGVSLDLDIFDLVDAPGVGSPEADGLPMEELLSGLEMLRNYEGFQALY